MICRERAAQREEFRSMHRRRGGRRWDPYPPELQEVPPFSQWLTEEVEDAKEQGIVVSEDVEELSEPPSLQAKRFRSITLTDTIFA